jgi:hypothetical protein
LGSSKVFWQLACKKSQLAWDSSPEVTAWFIMEMTGILKEDETGCFYRWRDHWAVLVVAMFEFALIILSSVLGAT